MTPHHNLSLDLLHQHFLVMNHECKLFLHYVLACFRLHVLAVWLLFWVQLFVYACVVPAVEFLGCVGLESYLPATCLLQAIASLPFLTLTMSLELTCSVSCCKLHFITVPLPPDTEFA
jgi:hypothetical protein